MSARKPVIIAEAGVNHNGEPDRALLMVRAAAQAGADYVKFQTFKAEKLVTAYSHTAEYQKRNCDADSQLEMLRRLELKPSDFGTLAEECRRCGIGFLSTPFDGESVAMLANLGMDYMKVPSGEITNLPYLRCIAATGIPVMMSTGMSGLADIEGAVNVFLDAGYDRSQITLLHCNTQYPTPFEGVNLRAMDTLRNAFGVEAGYSDHTRGIEVPVAAAALGAAVIEKHFTLDRNLPGPDHAASLQPDELEAMVRAVRNVTAALGSPVKQVSPSESANIAVARKSIVASRPIRRGEILDSTNMAAKRPGTGLSPMLWDTVCGLPAPRDFDTDQQITLS